MESFLCSQVVTLIGIILLIFAGIGSYSNRKIMRRCSHSAEAKVIGLDRKRKHVNGHVHISYCPTIQFEDVTGNIQTVTASYDVAGSVCKEGDLIQIQYDPENPSNFVIADTLHPPVTLYVITIPFLCLGIWLGYNAWP